MNTQFYSFIPFESSFGLVPEFGHALAFSNTHTTLFIFRCFVIKYGPEELMAIKMFSKIYKYCMYRVGQKTIPK